MDVELVPDRDRPQAFTLRVGGADQSHVDLGDPLALEFDYVRRMADVIDELGTPGAPMRFVHVGGAAMTLPRYVTATRPTSAQIVLEPDELLTQYVREHLPLPTRSGIKVRAVDGRSGVEALRDAFADVVVLDAYDGARVPAELTTLEYFSTVRRVIGERGTFLINLADSAPFTYVRRALAGVRAVFPDVVMSAEPATLKGRRFGNVLLVASASPIAADALTTRAARSVFPYRVVMGVDLARRFGDGRPFTDADAHRSPEPPRGMFG